MAATDMPAGGSAGNYIATGDCLAILEAVAVEARASRLERERARIGAHVHDGDPAIRRHARDWLRQLDTEQAVLGRWQAELAAQIGAVLS